MIHKRNFIFYILLAVYILSSSTTVSAETANVFDYDKGAMYSSSEYYDIAQTLAATYPEILHLEIIGYSRDSKPIYAIIMTANVKEAIARDDFNLYREHYYVEGGTHGRETVNTPIIIKAIQDLSLIHISEPTRRTPISYAVFCLKKK